MDFYWLLLGTLGTWRLTHLLAVESGPFAVIARLRRLAGSGLLGQLLDCFYCLSLWSAALIALPIAHGALHYFYLCLALSAGSILVESITHRESSSEPVYYEESIGGPLGENSVMLRENEIWDHKGDAHGRVHRFEV